MGAAPLPSILQRATSQNYNQIINNLKYTLHNSTPAVCCDDIVQFNTVWECQPVNESQFFLMKMAMQVDFYLDRKKCRNPTAILTPQRTGLTYDMHISAFTH